MKEAERKEEVKGCVSAGTGMWGRGDTDFHCLEKEAPPRREGAAGAGGGEGGGGGSAEQGSPPPLREVAPGCERLRPAARSRLWFSRPDVGCALSEGDGRRAAGPAWEGFLLGLPGHMLSLQRAFWSTEALSAQFKSAGSLHSENPADHRTI